MTGRAPHILLSAFTCAPGRGSETGVAWNWVLALARARIAVTVVTQARNRAAIEAWRADGGAARLSGVRFVYVSLFGDGPIPFGTAGHYLHYYLWQAAALVALVRGGAWRRATAIHHLVYGGINAGSLLFLLPRPFLFGPVGGGETAPLRLVRRFGRGAMLTETARSALIALARINPVLLAMQLRACRVLAKTPETARCLWAGGGRRHVRFEIGAPDVAAPPAAPAEGGPCRLLFAGRLLYWKGAELLADALLLLDRPGAGLAVTVIGAGPRGDMVAAAFARLRHIPAALRGAVPQPALFAAYRDADLLLFLSLHDSSGNVVLEAMAFGVPVLCLDLGGPPLLAGEGGIAVPARGERYDAVVAALADAIRRLADDPAARGRLAAQARARAASLTWDAAVAAGYGPLIGGT